MSQRQRHDHSSNDGVEKSAIDRMLARGGEMGSLMRAFDWSKTPLGPIETWPPSLKNAVSVMMPSKAQICLFWGPEYTFLYNDAYSPTLAEKHPHVLGVPGWECWGEVWDVLTALFQRVLANRTSIAEENYPFLLNRRGFTEEAYYDISYDPMLLEDDSVGGIFCIVNESTRHVLGDRRLQTLRELGARSSEAKSAQEACELTLNTLADHRNDVPFALVYLLDKQGQKAILTSCMGTEAGKSASPLEIDLTTATDEGWPLDKIYRSSESLIIPDLESRFDDVPAGIWPNPPQRAIVLPLLSTGKCIGFLIAGISPRLFFDDQYEGFYGLIAGHLEKAIEFARAYENERERATALAELDRAKTVFFSNISHEFRTPLTLILEPLNTLLDNDGLSAEQVDTLRLMQRNSQRLLKLVNTLLDFSRIEAGRADINFEPTNLASYTADLASTFRSAMEKAGLRLVVNCPPLPEPIYVDREMWEKIVLNLLSNAFKFTFEGRVEVNLQAYADHVELQVCDTGVGIPSQELSQVFERFHRVRGTRSRTHEGTGIGLALVQDLVHLHKGEIRVESSENKGTVFTISIPRGFAHLPPDRIQTQRSLASTSVGAMPYVEEALRWLPGSPTLATDEMHGVIPSETRDLSKPLSSGTLDARIILADDNTDMREYVGRLLSAHYTVEAYADGAQALEAVQKHIPDLLLTDVMMPTLDGFELLRALRSDSATQSLPIILLSARAGEEARIEGMQAGADDYLIKPFSARELMARVDAQLQLSRLRRGIVERNAFRVALADAIRPLTNPHEIQATASHILSDHLRVDHVTYVDGSGNEAEPAHPEFSAKVIESLRRGKTVIVSNVANDAQLGEAGRAFYAAIHVRAFVGVGLLKDGNLAARLGVYSAEPRVWTSDEVVLIMETAERTWAAVEWAKTVEALSSSEEHFRALVTASSDVVYRMSSDWSEMHELQGRNFIADTTDPSNTWLSKYIHPDDQTFVLNAVNEAIRTKSMFQLEHRVLRVNGSIGWTFSRALPMLNDDGEITEWFGAASDITERMELYQQTKELAAIEERQRLARELHDSVTQSLFSATIIAQSVPELWQTKPERAMVLLDDTVKLVRAAMAEMRTLLLELRPQAIIATAFDQLLDHLVVALRGRMDVQVEITQEGKETPLDADVHLALYRIIQESFNNIAKHSYASNVKVHLKREPNLFEFTITDDGHGFDTSTPSAGFGLNSIQERAANIGATIKVISHPGDGTTLVLHWEKSA